MHAAHAPTGTDGEQHVHIMRRAHRRRLRQLPHRTAGLIRHVRTLRAGFRSLHEESTFLRVLGELPADVKAGER